MQARLARVELRAKCFVIVSLGDCLEHPFVTETASWRKRNLLDGVPRINYDVAVVAYRSASRGDGA
jgi:hypothetical protein